VKKTLVFRGTAQWVTNAVVDGVKRHTSAVAEIRCTGQNNSGTLIISAATQQQLDSALAYIAGDPLYKLHFTQK